jgi:hypothetical protein
MREQLAMWEKDPQYIKTLSRSRADKLGTLRRKLRSKPTPPDINDAVAKTASGRPRSMPSARTKRNCDEARRLQETLRAYPVKAYNGPL